MEYALTQPDGLLSLTIADSPASMRQWVAEANRLRAQLPLEVQQTLRKHEEAGTTDDDEYEEAMMVFYRRHVCRLDPWPEYVRRTFAHLAENPEVYHTMNGPSEFHVTGTLKEWDIVDRLGEIRVPTLVISGRYDEATPAITETVPAAYQARRGFCSSTARTCPTPRSPSASSGCSTISWRVLRRPRSPDWSVGFC
jgi:L-proline amide hydrolase